MGKKIERSPFITITATGMITEDRRETPDEKKYFRVMPVDMTGNGVEKMYFDSREQYMEWRQRIITKDEKYKEMNIHIIPGLKI